MIGDIEVLLVWTPSVQTASLIPSRLRSTTLATLALARRAGELVHQQVTRQSPLPGKCGSTLSLWSLGTGAYLCRNSITQAVCEQHLGSYICVQAAA